MNIQEDYVSFEVAKLLKEKGFDGDTNCYYIEGSVDKNRYYSPTRNNHNKRITNNEFDININIDSGSISAPTLQMAMKWLREVHKLHIGLVLQQDVKDEEDAIENGYFFNISRLDRFANEGGDCKFYNSYEQACDAAIKYCLENLI